MISKFMVPPCQQFYYIVVPDFFRLLNWLVRVYMYVLHREAPIIKIISTCIRPLILLKLVIQPSSYSCWCTYLSPFLATCPTFSVRTKQPCRRQIEKLHGRWTLPRGVLRNNPPIMLAWRPILVAIVSMSWVSWFELARWNREYIRHNHSNLL